mmetsp:Transcript_27434/g.59608  ORF Transcript_27434/g.59608 Transcript_27434/m.59608 type:complete len:212 (+) Transcript_27434:120-755(+)
MSSLRRFHLLSIEAHAATAAVGRTSYPCPANCPADYCPTAARSCSSGSTNPTAADAHCAARSSRDPKLPDSHSGSDWCYCPKLPCHALCCGTTHHLRRNPNVGDLQCCHCCCYHDWRSATFGCHCPVPDSSPFPCRCPCHCHCCFRCLCRCLCCCYCCCCCCCCCHCHCRFCHYLCRCCCLGLCHRPLCLFLCPFLSCCLGDVPGQYCRPV